MHNGIIDNFLELKKELIKSGHEFYSETDSEVLAHLVDHYYSGVTRYTTSTFLRMKLGDALQKRDVAPHIYESSKEARQALRKK